MDQQTEQLKHALTAIIRNNLSPETWGWLAEKSILGHQSAQQLNIAFMSIPRKTGKDIVHATAPQQEAIAAARPGFSIEGWTIDRLCRVWLLLHTDAAKKEIYIQNIENLFSGAEMNELVALYSSLPLLQYPESWAHRCTEGIRSNIGIVLEAVICDNPYPSEQLSEGAWNQLVMKAFFTDKPIHKITGLDQRANEELAHMLWDYANERWAASRTVNPQLWRCIGQFIDAAIFPGIERLYHSPDTIEKEAAALACHASKYAPAKDLLNRDVELKTRIESGQLTWDTLAKKLAVQV